MRFSERCGYKASVPMLEEHELPKELRNQIWNVLLEIYFTDIRDPLTAGYSYNFKTLSKHLRPLLLQDSLWTNEDIDLKTN